MNSATYMRPLPSNRITAGLTISGSASTSSMRYPGGSRKVEASSFGVRGLTGGLGEKSAPALDVEDNVPPPGAGACGAAGAAGPAEFCSALGAAEKVRAMVASRAAPATNCNRFHIRRLVARGWRDGQE